MRIAELESHYVEYRDKEKSIQQAISQNSLHLALHVSRDSLQHLIPATKYQKRKEVSLTTPFLPIVVMCKYAPPLFERELLDSTREFVVNDRSLTRSAEDYLSQIDEAILRIDCARTMWNRLELSGICTKHDLTDSLPAPKNKTSKILLTWETLGITERCENSDGEDSLQLRTRLSAKVEGACYECGLKGVGPKSGFFKHVKCTRCGREDFFHIRSTRD